MEYCQGFLLQNMVALLTYDDSVKRLLFAKKIPNHDVLSGLLTTLQKRIEIRRTLQTTTTTQQQQQQNVKPTAISVNGKTSSHRITTNNINNNYSGEHKQK
jgi:ankyrin repeat/BTB/POZ domain-containing protein 2